jgi:hypothetical protein
MPLLYVVDCMLRPWCAVAVMCNLDAQKLSSPHAAYMTVFQARDIIDADV